MAEMAGFYGEGKLGEGKEAQGWEKIRVGAGMRSAEKSPLSQVLAVLGEAGDSGSQCPL